MNIMHRTAQPAKASGQVLPTNTGQQWKQKWHRAMLACVHGQLVQMTLSIIYYIADILWAPMTGTELKEYIANTDQLHTTI